MAQPCSGQPDFDKYRPRPKVQDVAIRADVRYGSLKFDVAASDDTKSQLTLRPSAELTERGRRQRRLLPERVNEARLLHEPEGLAHGPHRKRKAKATGTGQYSVGHPCPEPQNPPPTPKKWPFLEVTDRKEYK